MKYLVWIFLVAVPCFSLAEPPDTLDHFPNYRVRGGTPVFIDTIQKNLRYPLKALQKGIVGTGVVSFVLTPSGETSGWAIVNSLGRHIDTVVVEAFKSTKGLWTADSLEERDYILFFPVHFFTSEKDFSFTPHKAGFMLTPIQVSGYTSTGRTVRSDYYHIEKLVNFYHNQNYKKALKHLDELIRRDPFSDESHKARAFCHLKLGNRLAACQDYQKLATLLHQRFPTNSQAWCQDSLPLEN